MLTSLLYLLVRRLLRLLMPTGLDPLSQEAEILVLRHQLKVLRRQAKRPSLRRSDRVLLAAMARLLPRDRWGSFIVTPSTLLRWHRELLKRKWTYHSNRQGRPMLEPPAVELVVRLGKQNPRWGYRRIQGELQKLGIRVSASSVATILRRHGLGPGLWWTPPRLSSTGSSTSDRTTSCSTCTI